MASTPRVRAHDPDSHKGWQVDWCDWLEARGFAVDGSTIVATSFTVPAPATETFDDRSGSVSRVWIEDVPEGETIEVQAHISMPSPGGGAPLITDTFTFKLRGRQT